MSAFQKIPRTVLFGTVSHLKKVNRELTEAMTELLAATDARMALGSADDRLAANARVLKAYDRCAVLMHWRGNPIPSGKPSKLKRLNLSNQAVLDL